ncbi:unnamed protein product [Prorocentrum cordatum]|uniref:Guanine nucleotide-binding protein subunit beta-like protein n=1 Tax=Prorocentrum cordatum TaxID=2364126 RepID=A0ABN9XWQ4_9DINO|nr:unnamed protein product [Polarella glacialis]
MSDAAVLVRTLGGDEVAIRVRDGQTVLDPRAPAGPLRGSAVDAVACGCPSSFALAGGADGALRVWDLDTAACVGDLVAPPGHGAVLAAALAGTKAATGAADGAVRLWDLEEMALVGSLLPPGGADGAPETGLLALAVDFGAGRLLSCGVDGAVRLWDLEAMCLLGCLLSHAGVVRTLAADFGRQRALTGADDRSVRLWDTASRNCLGVLRGHRGPLTTSSADFGLGRAATAGFDLSVRIWDLERLECLATLRGHRRAAPRASTSLAVGQERIQDGPGPASPRTRSPHANSPLVLCTDTATLGSFSLFVPPGRPSSPPLDSPRTFGRHAPQERSGESRRSTQQSRMRVRGRRERRQSARL